LNKIRFGIAGAGFIGRTHAEAIKRLNRTATLVAVACGSRASDVAADYGAACLSSAEELAHRKDIDAIVIATPQALHFRQAWLALEAGKHVLIEKPIATNLADCDKLLGLAARRNLVVALGYALRFRTNPPRARELIAAGAIGRVVAMHHTTLMDGESFKAGAFPRTKWFNLPENLGIIIDALPHGIDTMRWLTGAEVKSVVAFTRRLWTDQPHQDTAVAALEFSDGAIGSLIISCAVPGPYPGETARYSIIGTEGLMNMDAFGDLHISDRKNGWRLVASQPPVGKGPDAAFGDVRMKAFCDQIQSFIDGIHGNPMVAGSGLDGRAGLAVCLGILRSSEERRPISP
jgi:predicted dehydrogenase